MEWTLIWFLYASAEIIRIDIRVRFPRLPGGGGRIERAFILRFNMVRIGTHIACSLEFGNLFESSLWFERSRLYYQVDTNQPPNHTFSRKYCGAIFSSKICFCYYRWMEARGSSTKCVSFDETSEGLIPDISLFLWFSITGAAVCNQDIERIECVRKWKCEPEHSLIDQIQIFAISFGYLTLLVQKMAVQWSSLTIAHWSRSMATWCVE